MDKKETTRLLDSLIKYNRVDINNMKGQFPELGDAFMNVILAIDQEYGSGNIDRNLLKTPPLQTVVYDNIQTSVTNNQTQNLPFKVGDEFQQYGRGAVFVISAIKAIRVDISWTDSNGKRSASYDIKDAITYFNDKSWILVDKIIPDPTLNNNLPNLTANQVSFKLGDLFTVKGYSQDIYVINEMGSDKVGIRNTTNNVITRAGYPSTEKSFKSGEYILLPPTSVKNPNISISLTGWTKDWKAMGLRPSPTRKASLELIDAVGMGNDGNVYEVVTDKNGTKKWKKTRFDVFADSTRQAFTELYDLQLLYDQIVYENSQLDPIDIDYNENEKLIIKIIEELKTK